jgi:hypothetical protein
MRPALQGIRHYGISIGLQFDKLSAVRSHGEFGRSCLHIAGIQVSAAGYT